MKYITKQLHRLEMFESKHPFLCTSRVFFFHVLCIKCTFPASASTAVIDVITTQLKTKKKKRKKRQKMEYKKNQQAETS